MSTVMKHMPPVVVDEGNVTVLRRMSAYTWGRYSVTWPEGFEPPELAPDRELGFVAKLPTPEGGRFSRRFVRADAEVDAANGYSDVEQVLDEAEQRTGGDVFFERDITTAGLGRLIPRVHFDIGDIIPVRVWGRVIHLPVTSIDEVSETGDRAGWRVHVGGQLISDRDALEAGTSELERVIAQERRERMEADDVIGAAASDAQESADTAQESADGLTEDLTGDPGGSVPDAVEQRTGALGGIKRDVDQAQTEQLILHDNQLKWLRWTKTVFNFGFSTASGERYNIADEIETGMVDVLVNEFSDRGLRWIVRPGWTGTYRVDARFTDGSEGSVHGRATGQANAFSSQDYLTRTVSRVSVQVWPDRGVEPREWAVQVQHNQGGQPQFVPPQGLGAEAIIMMGADVGFAVPVVADHDVMTLGRLVESGSTINREEPLRPASGESSGVVVFTEVMPALRWEVGLPRTGSQTIQIPSRTVVESSRLGTFYYSEVGSWTALDWDRPVTATITYSIRWAEYSAWALADYRTQIQINGVTQTWLSRSTTGGMNTHFTETITVTLRAGDVVTIGAGSQEQVSSNRRMSGHFTVNWR